MHGFSCTRLSRRSSTDRPARQLWHSKETAFKKASISGPERSLKVSVPVPSLDRSKSVWPCFPGLLHSQRLGIPASCQALCKGAKFGTFELVAAISLGNASSTYIRCTFRAPSATLIRPFFERAVPSLASIASQRHGTQPRVVASHAAWLDQSLRRMARRPCEFRGRYKLEQRAQNHGAERTVHLLKSVRN